MSLGGLGGFWSIQKGSNSARGPDGDAWMPFQASLQQTIFIGTAILHPTGAINRRDVYRLEAGHLSVSRAKVYPGWTAY